MSPGLTPFAGLEVLDPVDLLSADGFRFQSINPTLIDRLLQIGAITHRHDEHAALANPAVAPAVTTSTEGGTIASGKSVSVRHAWVDQHGGETLGSPVTTVVTAAGLKAPQNPPTLANDYTAGALLAGNYTYAVTVTDGVGGETTIGPSAAITVDPGFPKARVTVSGLKALLEEVKPGIGAAKWRLWRQLEGGPWYLMATGVENVVQDDGTLVGDCTVEPPERGTTVGTNSIKVVVPAAPAGTEYFRLYVSEGGSFTSPCFVAQYPLGEIGKTIVVATLALLTGSPPLVTQSYPGATKINPDTDLIEWHWKRPFKKVSELPAVGNLEGDVRLTTEDRHLHYWTGTEWLDITTTQTLTTTHTFALRGPVALEPPIPPHEIEVPVGQVTQLLAVRYKILAGTSLSFRIQNNGVDIAGYGTAGAPLVAKPELKRSGEAVALASGDGLAPLLSASAGEPSGGVITLVLRHIVG